MEAQVQNPQTNQPYQRNFEQWKNIQHPNIQCGNSHPVTYICCNTFCQSDPYICDGCRACTRKHPNCEKSNLQDITNLLQERSMSVNKIVKKMDQIERRLKEEFQRRRENYIHEAYLEGLDPRQADAIEAIYFQRQGVDLKGYHIDDIYDCLAETRIDANSIDNRISMFEQEMGRVYRESSDLQHRLLFGEDLNSQVKTLQISKYGYYDLTCAMQAVPREEKRKINNLVLINRCKSLMIQAQKMSDLGSKLFVTQHGNFRSNQLVFFSLYRSKDDSTQSKLEFIQLVKMMRCSQSKKNSIQGIFILIQGEMSNFIAEMSRFPRIQQLTLQVLHPFASWRCFDELTDLINRRLTRLTRLYISVPVGQEQVAWTKKLREGIQVSVSSLSDRSVMRIQKAP